MIGWIPHFATIFAVTVISGPEQILPTKPGMTWHYDMTEEAGPGARLSDEAAREAGTLKAPVIYRIEAAKEIDGKQLLEFEMHRAGRVTNTDLITADEKGVLCWGRMDEAGQLTKLDPPQPIVAAPIAVGSVWDFDSDLNGVKVHQHYEVVGQGEITTRAGEFRAFHIRGEQDAPGPMTIDRWFAPGVGIIKDVTETRSDSGQLLRKISLELTEQPKIAARPQITVKSDPSKLEVSLGPEAVGESRNTFMTAAPKICARWQGHGLREGAKIRVLWIAEEVEEVAPPDYTIDEAASTATAPDSHGVLTLARPESGWTPGIYRVEFYVDGRLADAAKLKILKSEASRFEPFTPGAQPGLEPP